MYCKNNHEKINKEFLNPTDPHIAYILGLLWADGSVEYNPNKYRARISIEVKKSDFDYFITYLNKFANWRISFRNRKGFGGVVGNDFGTARLSNKIISEFLITHNYKTKYSSPCSIIDLLPDNIKHYFFRGLSDGDGSFYYNSKNSGNIFNISSEHNQDWSYLIKLCNILNIQYRIDRSIFESGYKGSTFNISRRKDIIIIGNYIYNGFENDKIGLPRKFNTFQNIKNYLP